MGNYGWKNSNHRLRNTIGRFSTASPTSSWIYIHVSMVKSTIVVLRHGLNKPYAGFSSEYILKALFDYIHQQTFDKDANPLIP